MVSDVNLHHYTEAYAILEQESRANFEVGEMELVRDVLFACQGIDGKHIKYSR